MGKNCLKEVLKTRQKRLIEIYTCQKQNDDLYQTIKKTPIPLIETSKKRLFDLVKSESHQSYVAKVTPRLFTSIKDFLKTPKDKSLVLMLDTINDPHNLGAILRAAECFGVDLVIYSKNRGADITPTVSKTSAGASELVALSKVSNLAETLKAFKQADYWVYGADVSSPSLYQTTFPPKTLIIMGSEGAGIQPLLNKLADGHFSIPMHGQIDSLNVSQATAVILSYLRS